MFQHPLSFATQLSVTENQPMLPWALQRQEGQKGTRRRSRFEVESADVTSSCGQHNTFWMAFPTSSSSSSSSSSWIGNQESWWCSCPCASNTLDHKTIYFFPIARDLALEFWRWRNLRIFWFKRFRVGRVNVNSYPSTRLWKGFTNLNPFRTMIWITWICMDFLQRSFFDNLTP